MYRFVKDIPAPWLEYYGETPPHLDYPESTMAELMENAAAAWPESIAFDFLGRATSYRKFAEEIRRAARAFAALGIREHDRVTVCMPNTPQGVIALYALNMAGAVANMIHPLSSEGEIRFFLEESESVAALTLDQFYPKFAAVMAKTKLSKLIITSVGDALSPLMKLGYKLTEGRKIARVRPDGPVILWKDFLALGEGYTQDYRVPRKPEDPAVILYSGGTSGSPKGILLSNLNFNALAQQTIIMDGNYRQGDSILSVMPMFHGFGLGVCIHTFLSVGGRCILVPRFNAQTYGELLMKQQPNYIAGVPTLYEALLRNPDMDNVDLSCLKGVFSGGDSLSVELKKKFDKFLAEHNARVEVREGYGLTECVTASCLTPYTAAREGSIGIPFPDTYYAVCRPGSTEKLPPGEEGEICLTGPTLMLGYLNNPEETADALRLHADGYTWLHTGDLGLMDEDGFVYFRQRLKRMIISSGYSIYPSQLENIFDAHEKVHMSCVIGVPDALKGQKIKAFVMLKPGVAASDDLRRELLDYAQLHIARYSLPYDIEFRNDLPRTLVGKVAYTVLEAEEEQKRLAAAAAGADQYGALLPPDELAARGTAAAP